MTVGDKGDLVRRGYDALSYHYRSDDAGEAEYAPWLAELRARLPTGASVLDLGCGNGVPVARSLAAAGYQVTGVDISDVQVERARHLVLTGTFIRADATTIEFPAQSFDAIVCLYALIHMPLASQPGLLQRAADWLRPRGGSWRSPGTARGPVPKTTGLAARPRCRGARPTRAPTAHGLSRRAFTSPPRSSSPRGLADMNSSGHVGRQADPSGLSSRRNLPRRPRASGSSRLGLVAQTG
jgi:SAM-dependent methyltransferase